MPNPLDDPCRYLEGVGPRRAEALARLEVRTVEDLLLHLPRRYYDRRQLSPVRSLQAGSPACVRVRVESLQARPSWQGRSMHVATVSDDTGKLRVVWFNSWVGEALRPGNLVVLAGPVVVQRGRLEMRQPEFELVEKETQELVHAGRIVPLYALTRGISQKWVRALVRRALDRYLPAAHEVLPEAVRGDLQDRRTALHDAHFPAAPEAAVAACRRLKFEELFVFQLLLARRRLLAGRQAQGVPMRRHLGLQERYLAALPFELTGAQRRVLEEIFADLESGRWMQRLVQGDVGAGKTVIAAAALFLAVGNGWQGALMAPTETLAMQHAERLAPACRALGVRLELLIGSRPERDKEILRERLARGDVDLVVGTHALIQEGTDWARLGLAVVDEQQRFGVLQRGLLQRSTPRPHVLVLSATPIPRSLALTLFGDLDVSRLDEKPPGRRPVRTHLVPPERRAAMYDFVRRQIETGGQAFVVLPLIEESDKVDLRAASEEYERLAAGPFAGCRVGLLHGRLPAAEKERLLHDFGSGRLRLLVSTTVIEVGLDVASASIMVVHHPERFGLSQLHQLRGRVGRAAAQSFCFLILDADTPDEARARLDDFAGTEDGFRIAELDLERRGPGDLMGTRQHGLPALRLADLAADLEILEAARRAAFEVVRQDPELERVENAALKAHVESRFREQEALAGIG